MHNNAETAQMHIKLRSNQHLKS